ncbi:MAG TPA: hypothetical protein VF897_22845 [Roseiflexaceae bacterium]
MPEELQEYYSFLLRLWQTSSGGSIVWRASLESAQTGERYGFADLASLFAFLKEQTSGDASQDEHSQPSGP